MQKTKTILLPRKDFLTIRIAIESVLLVRIANQPRFLGIGFPKEYKNYLEVYYHDMSRFRTNMAT